MFIGPIERLSEDELSRVGVVANIQPVADAAIWTGESFVNLCSRGAAVHATDDEVQIVMQIVASAQMLGDCLPVEPPKKVQAVDKDNGFEQPNLARGEWLADTVRCRDPVPIDDGHRQAGGVPGGDQRLVKMRQPTDDRAARPPATD